MNKTTITSAIVVSALIIGISLIVINNKKINAEQAKENYNNLMLDNCLQGAEMAYWDYIELNGTKQEDGSILALTRHWNYADDKKQDETDLCFKRYN